MIKVYDKTIKGFKTIVRTFILSQSGNRAKIHSVGEINLADIKNDDVEVRLDESVLLFVHADADDDATVKLMYPDGTVNVISAWKLKATCTEVIKIFDTDTTVPNAQLFLSK